MLPTSLREWLQESHLVRCVIGIEVGSRPTPAIARARDRG
jgi:hypothetical protein